AHFGARRADRRARYEKRMENARDGSQIGGASIAPTRTSTCRYCGAPIGEERWFVVEYPKAAHARCMDWSTRPFRFEREIDVLLLLSRRHPRLADRRALQQIATKLAALRRRWPHDAVNVLDDGERLIRSARPLLAPLDHRDRMRL